MNYKRPILQTQRLINSIKNVFYSEIFRICACMFSDESCYHQIKKQINLQKTKPTKETKKILGRRTEKQTLWQKEQGLIVNEESLTHTCPQRITYTTSALQRTVLIQTHVTYILENNIFLKYFSGNSSI